MKAEAQTSGVFSNFLTIVSSKTNDVFKNIIGGYGYVPKNNFSYDQKQKMLDYLKTKIFTLSAKMQEAEKIRFIDFDEHFLDNVPKDIDELRNKIMRARTNI